MIALMQKVGRGYRKVYSNTRLYKAKSKYSWYVNMLRMFMIIKFHRLEKS